MDDSTDIQVWKPHVIIVVVSRNSHTADFPEDNSTVSESVYSFP